MTAPGSAVLLDILICSIAHRHEKLCELLAELDRQMRPEAAARICRDNLQASYGAKCAALTASSAAEYICFIDDDDLIAPAFIECVLEALRSRPDYVGYPVVFTEDGIPQQRVEHSLRHGGWSDSPGLLARDISEKNPIRRELALLGTWAGGWAAEREWAAGVRASGKVKTEAWVGMPMYYFRHQSADNFHTQRQPLASVPPLPAYPWLTEVAVP